LPGTSAAGGKPSTAPAAQPQASHGSIVGNSNSHLYHLPSGCPSYDKVAAKNRVSFESEAQAQAQGYKKAGNCR